MKNLTINNIKKELKQNNWSVVQIWIEGTKVTATNGTGTPLTKSAELSLTEAKALVFKLRADGIKVSAKRI